MNVNKLVNEQACMLWNKTYIQRSPKLSSNVTYYITVEVDASEPP